MVMSQMYQCINQIVVRYDGEIICSKETMGEDFHYLKLPYRSGTIIAGTASPFLPPVKGILFNHAELEESGFAENEYNQWLVCSQIRAQEATNGIGIINLTDYYNPFSDECDCNLSYKQLFTPCQGELDEGEEWLTELSKMVREDKSVMDKMLADRQPKAADNLSKRRLAYVKSLKRM